MAAIHAQCASNSTFLACDYGSRFLGCCLSTISSNEACGTGCPDSSLTSLSFNKGYYNSITEGTCGTSEGKWYTCPDSDPPFLGCCKSDPCLPGGCPEEDLVAAKLSEDQAQQAAYEPVIAGPSSSSTNSVTSIDLSASSSVSSVSAATADPTTAAAPSSTTILPAAASSQLSTAPSTPVVVGAVVGGLIGGILLSLAIAALFVFYKRRKKQERRTHGRKDSDQLDMLPRSPSRTLSSTYHEMSIDHPTQELHSTPVPLRELASKEIPIVHELPSPVPSSYRLETKRSMSSIGSQQHDPVNVSPLVGPYSSNSAAAVSEVSLPEASARNVE